MDAFLELIADVMDVDVSEVSMDMKYQDGKWDSMMMLNLVMEIEAEYNVSIPIESLGNVKTLADLYEFTK